MLLVAISLAMTVTATAQTVDSKRDTVAVVPTDTTITITMPASEAKMLDVIDFEPADPSSPYPNGMESSDIIEVEGEMPQKQKGWFTIDISGGLGLLSTSIEIDDNGVTDNASGFAYRVSADYVGPKGWGGGLAYAAWSTELSDYMPMKMMFVGPYLAVRTSQEKKWQFGCTFGIGYGSVKISAPGWGGWSYEHLKKSGLALDAVISMEYRFCPNIGLAASITANSVMAKSDKQGPEYSDKIAYSGLLLGLRIHL